MWTSKYEEVVDKKTVQHKDGITPVTLQKSRKRKDRKAAPINRRTRVAKSAAQNECNEVHGEVKKALEQIKDVNLMT